ncbi:MAG: ABC-type transport auxiliary lipoprotein family protein [Planctomycetota bacterium]
MNRKIIVLCNLIIVSMIISGCGPKRIGYNQTNFVLDVSRDLDQQEIVDDEIILDVYSFNIDSAFGSKSLVYRKSESKYETDFYNKFLISPDDMITEKTRAWLSESGLFEMVAEPGSYLDATHALQGSIIALYGDFRDKSSPKATMKIRLFLVNLSDKTVVFNKTYEAVSEAEDRTADSIVSGLNNCLINILTELENDLSVNL